MRRLDGVLGGLLCLVGMASGAATTVAKEAGPVCVSARADLFQAEVKSETADREAMRQAAVELIYMSQLDPKLLGSMIAEKIRSFDHATLDRALAKYAPELISETLSPLVREYLQNLYYALAVKRDIPPSVIQEKVGYGTEQQRTFRIALVERLRK